MDDSIRHTVCPGCRGLFRWSAAYTHYKLKGLTCDCGHQFTGHERPSYIGDQAWVDDDIQFPRLLAEIRATGLSNSQYKALQASMDLPRARINEIFDRAQAQFEKMKVPHG